jgi:hypothetical protein
VDGAQDAVAYPSAALRGAAMAGQAVAYYRVSTELQAREGFSLDGQRAAVHRYIADEGLELLAEHSEAEAMRSHLIELQVTQSHTDRETATIFNERGLRTSTGQLWTRHTVSELWRRYLRHGRGTASNSAAGGATGALATRRMRRKITRTTA